jgi:transposase InsO family protein
MAYNNNPYMPKVRRDAAALVHNGYTPTEVGRRFGVGSSTICKWVKKAQKYGLHPIPTQSSRPKHHPRELAEDVVQHIVTTRLKNGRYAEVVHRQLTNEGVSVSLSSVKRTLDRKRLIKKRSPWKRWHHSARRPEALLPGALVQIDTVHRMVSEKERIYVFTLLDVHSRWAYAKAFTTNRAGNTLLFVKEAQRAAPFLFQHLQTDHGPEFGKWFVRQVKIRHRHSRVRRPNDNAHLERFNRTIQEECLDKIPANIRAINRALPKYLSYYNSERLHLGINLQTPLQLLHRVQAID